MTQYFLGVDIGNTKSHALIITDAGDVAGFGTGGPGNHEVLGEAGFHAALHTVVTAALTTAALDRAQIAGAGYGIAGYDWDSDMPLMRRVIDTLGMNAPYKVVNDGMMGLIAGAKRGWGVCISAGTSSNARGRNPHGDEGRMTGNGWVCGEYGGGIELTYGALDAISRAWSLRGAGTVLSDLFCSKVSRAVNTRCTQHTRLLSLKPLNRAMLWRLGCWNGSARNWRHWALALSGRLKPKMKQ
jgi:N-acetylglucosamine kinase-like BadF-type ATPase